MRDEKEGRKKQTNNQAKQHSTPKAVAFPNKNELPRVGLEPTTLYTLDRTFIYGCAVLLCLVCLFDLACFFLSSLIKTSTFYIDS